MAQRRRDHRLGRVAELLLEVARQRAHVDADADRRAALERELHDFARLHRIGDVAGVEPQLRDAGFDRGERHAMIEMDVGDDRHGRARDDVRQAGRVARILTGHAHDLAARHRQPVDLLERLVVVGGVGRRHRLHGDRVIAADPDLLGVLRPARFVLEQNRLWSCAAGGSSARLLRLRARWRERRDDVVIRDGDHQHDQHREPADVHERFFFRVDRPPAQHLDQDEDRRGRRRAPGSAAG